ncbi:hypothetical protein QQ045_000385 [Rhodiola kirilowii]
MDQYPNFASADTINETVDSNSSVSDSPGGTRYWTPNCSTDKRPFLGQKFDTVKDAIKFYNDYASICGFSVRLCTGNTSKDGTVTLKRLVCFKQGFKRKSSTPLNTLDESKSKGRNRVVSRCGCDAKMCVKLVDGLKYAVYSLEERHNHYLVSTVGQKYLRINRCLTYDQKELLVSCSNVNVGSSSAFRLMKEMAGGYDKVGATLTDCKNFKRDLKTYIGGRDAQMIINNLSKKKDSCEGFIFEYFADEDGTLCRLFWADTRMVLDSKVFGDVISFDATYSTNKYNMVFVPFTGIDNHKSSITLAAGLLSKEDVESYIWGHSVEAGL